MAEGIAFSIVGKLAQYTVNPILSQINYLFFYNSNIQNLYNKVEELENRRNDVKLQVDAAERNADIIGDDVSAWLQKVDVFLENEIKFLNGVESFEMRCLFNICPNLKSRYLLSRKATEKTTEANNLVEAKFKMVSTPRMPVQELYVIPHEGLETRLSTKMEIKEALKDKDIGIIGICGMPGVGKTTLAKEIVNEVKVEELFKEVAFAVVSNDPDINKIQDQLAEMLGQKIEEKENKDARARRLHERLEGNNDKSILVVLDDVWKEIDLGTIGIPSPHDCKGLKFMFTTRIEETCCKMEAQRKFEIEVLNEKEGWQLFKDTSEISDDETDIVSIAKSIARECRGLPLALVVVGKALKKKAIYKWRDALQQLQKSRVTNLDGMRNLVYSRIELSYNFLESDEDRDLLLLCSLFAEDESIPIENLVTYARGLELFPNTETLNETRDRAYSIADNLKSCNLLQPSMEKNRVILHDVIRDFCLQMAIKEKGGYMVKHAGLKEWPEHDADELCSAISITFDKLDHLPSGLKYRNVKLLRVICRQWGECNISEEFFKDMKDLRVLELERMFIQIPSSIQLLTGLRTLSLIGCKIHSPIEFTNLSNLKALILADGDLEYLIDATHTIPNGTFGKLESLDLDELPKLIEICNGNLPRGVIKPQLFRNLMTVDITSCDAIRSLFPESVANNLVNLESLHIKFCIMLEEVVSMDARENEVTETCKMLEFPKLKKVKLVRLRRFKSFTSQSNSGVVHQTMFNQVNLPNVEELFVRSLGCIVTLLGKEMPITSLHKLTKVWVLSCAKLPTIAESDSIRLLQNLEGLDVKTCEALEVLFDFEGINVTNDDAETNMLGRLHELRLWSLPKLVHITRMVPKGIRVFQNLTELNVEDCNSLRYLFSPSIVNSLVALKSLQIEGCGALEEIIGREEDENTSEKRNIIMDANTPSNLHHFTQVISMDAKRNEVINMPEFPKLNRLNLGYLSNFKSFRSESNNDAILRTLFNRVTLPNMEKVELNGLHYIVKLVNMRVENSSKSLQNLEILEVEKCKALEVLFDFECLTIPEDHAESLFGRLRSLQLKSLDKLVHIIGIVPKGIRAFENLTSIVVERCGILKYLFSPSMAISLVALKVLEVSDCESIKVIVGKEEEEEEEGTSEIKRVEAMKTRIEFPKLDRLLLRNLSNIQMFCSLNRDLVFPLLKELPIENCPMMTKLSPWPVSAPKLDISDLLD